MNLFDVYEVLQGIASVSARTTKEQMLSKALEDETFRKVCIYAYDPFRTYGVKPELDRPGTGTCPLVSPDMWVLLGMLEARKLTGHAAQKGLDAAYEIMCPEGGIVLSRILRKDLRAGFTDGSINRVRPDTIPTFKAMLAHPYEAKRVKNWPVMMEPKLDGVRVLARVDYNAGTTQFFSRNGKPFPAIEHLGKDLLDLGLPDDPGTVWFFDGEAITSDFYDAVGAVRRKSEKADKAEFQVFDLITEQEFLKGSLGRNYETRRYTLEELIPVDSEGPIKRVEAAVAYNEDDIQWQYAEWRSQGFEGAIVKPLGGFWVPKRSHGWMKMKAQETLDLRVVDVLEGEGKYAGMLGAIVVDNDGTEVRVGSGLSDEQRRDLWEARNLVGRLIEVEYHEKTPDGSLRHPRFVRFRDDKDGEMAA